MLSEFAEAPMTPATRGHRAEQIEKLKTRRLEVERRMGKENIGSPMRKALAAVHTRLVNFEGWMTGSYRSPLELTPHLEVAKEQTRTEREHQVAVDEAESAVEALERMAK
jgi:hypothetical protein